MTSVGGVRIAMWSGPRNISTALMRSFENRPDTEVVDEPFYAAYLAATGLDHPMRQEVIQAGETDPQRVAAALVADRPGARAVCYQKHMCHHMLPQFPRDWLFGMVSCFLIRNPADVVASYASKRDDVSFDDLGFAQQEELFDAVADRLGNSPPVIDTRDVLSDPEGVLSALCQACGIAFSQRMLRWPPGRRASDGVWAAHWYRAVERSTGFVAPRPGVTELAPSLARLADRARPIYERLHALRITVPATGGRIG